VEEIKKTVIYIQTQKYTLVLYFPTTWKFHCRPIENFRRSVTGLGSDEQSNIRVLPYLRSRP